MSLLKSKTLILLTKMYPYGKYEPYITEELKILCASFDSVLVYPNEYYGEDAPHDKAFPANARVLNLNTRVRGYTKTHPLDYVFLCRTMLREFFKTDDHKSNAANLRSNLIHLWTQIRISHVFSRFLSEERLDPAQTVFYSYWFGKSAMLLSVLKERKLISRFTARAHSVELYHNGWGLLNSKTIVPAFKMLKLRNVDHLFTVSKHGERYLRERYSLGERLGTRYLGVSGPPQLPIRGAKGSFVIVTCSRLEPIKRVDRLVRALGKVKQQVKWVHLGGGSDLPKIEKMVRDLPSNVEVDLKGVMTNDQVIAWYAGNGADLFVNLSVVEGLPVSIMEALAYGIPVLATEVYGTPEAVIEGRNGFLLNVNFTDEELEKKIAHCMANPQLLIRMGEQSHELWKERFNASKNYSEFSEFLLQQ